MASLHPSSKILSILGLLPIALASEGSFFVIQGDPLVIERVDPFLSAGVPSNHVHNIFGADKFSANLDYDTMQQSTCNTFGPKDDNSNYWYPGWYFHDPKNGSFELVPTHLEIYYHLDPAPGYRQEFPPGFRMISGDAMTRTVEPDNIAQKSNNFICHGATDNNGNTIPDVKGSPGFADGGFTFCGAYPGYSGEIWFPFCWDGINEFEASDPYAHVTFPTNTDGSPNTGKCPDTHSTPLPQLFMEFHHDLDLFKGRYTQQDQPFVLAMGDPTGLGNHADFHNGWKKGVLQDAMKVVDPATNRTALNVGDSHPASDYFTNFYPEDVYKKCTIDPIVQEDAVGMAQRLWWAEMEIRHRWSQEAKAHEDGGTARSGGGLDREIRLHRHRVDKVCGSPPRKERQQRRQLEKRASSLESDGTAWQ
ncbi:MAG: hypothetical protein Q9227_002151 [Pyrenula ochraceoflavens]